MVIGVVIAGPRDSTISVFWRQLLKSIWVNLLADREIFDEVIA